MTNAVCDGRDPQTEHLFQSGREEAKRIMADLDIESEIFNGTQDVFSTMLGMELERQPFTGQDFIKSNLTSMIGLGGGIRGAVAIHCPAAVAMAITAGFLGTEVDELDEDVKDAIGEIANMVAGNLKVSYAANGMNIELAIPTSVVGESFRVSGMAHANRIVVALKMAEGPFWVELMYVAA